MIKSLQDFLVKYPGKAISFSDLSKELGASRQYIRVLYHQLKNEYPVPPFRNRGFAENDTTTRNAANPE